MFGENNRRTETSRQRRFLVAVGAGFAALSLSGCLVGTVTVPSDKVVPEACRAISNNTGKFINPISYPLGRITFEWDAVNNLLNEDNYTSASASNDNPDAVDKGTIVLQDNHYVLIAPELTPSAKGLNSLVTNDEFNKLGTNAAVAILNTDIGFTTGCLSYSIVDGVKTRVVELPSN